MNKHQRYSNTNLNSCLEMETQQARNESEIIEVNFIRESIKKSFKSLD